MNREKLEITCNQANERYYIKYFNINRNLFNGLLFYTLFFSALSIFVSLKSIGMAVFLLILFITLFLRFWYYAVLHCQIIIDPENMIYTKDFIFRRKINCKQIQLAEVYEKEITRTRFSEEHSLFVLQVYANGKKYNAMITIEKKDCYTVKELINQKIRIIEN